MDRLAFSAPTAATIVMSVLLRALHVPSIRQDLEHLLPVLRAYRGLPGEVIGWSDVVFELMTTCQPLGTNSNDDRKDHHPEEMPPTLPRCDLEPFTTRDFDLESPHK